jgi:LysM repeat protein
VPRDELRRYAAPVGFLLAVTIAVVLIRAGMNSGRHSPTAAPPPSTTQQVAETTTSTTVRTTPHKAAAKKFWTVQAGDTFGVIAAKSGVPVATIEQLNPAIHSTSLFIGEKVRIK